MTDLHHTFFENRGILRISGGDSVEFLQGLVSNDVRKISPERIIYSALLTPQGKFLFDFFMYRWDQSILIEVEREQIGEIIQKLSIYKLRANVTIENASDDWSVAAVWGTETSKLLGLPDNPGSARLFQDGVVAVDPRLAAAGARAILPPNNNINLPSSNATPADYDLHRLNLALPDGSRDLVKGKDILLENGFDELNAIDWNKGCYMGQELTARTKYRGLIKKRLVPITINGTMPCPGTAIILNGKKVGEVRSGSTGRALALIRLEQLNNPDAVFTADSSTISPYKPDWANF